MKKLTALFRKHILRQRPYRVAAIRPATPEEIAIYEANREW